MGERPAGRLDAGLGSGGGGIGVVVVGIGEVSDMECAGRRVDGEGEVVDVVKAVVARLAGGKDIAESDVVTRACVGGEVDGAVYIVGAAVVDGGDGSEGGGVGEACHDTDL